MSEKVGIISYGAYVPKYRIKVEEIAKVWGDDAESIKKGLNIFQKSVPDMDEDTVTIAVEAARLALKRRDNLDPRDIGAIYVGSESHPYIVKPSGTIIAAAINAGNTLTVSDFEFACKAGTAAIQVCMGLVKSGMIKFGLAIGADVSQGAPGDALEYTAAAGGAAFIIGGENIITEIEDTFSFTSDTPDFWRREGQDYPRHGGRFTGEPAYFRHIISASKGLMEKMGTEPKDYDYAVFHQPNGKFPVRVAKILGFTKEQIEPGLLVPWIGNTYSGSSMLGLAATLDVAKPGERIFLTSFGSGAGSDAFSMIVTDEIESIERNPKLRDMIENVRYVDYGIYTKHKRKLKV
jgi:hydroxymethylglutaryl-CoA synthase